MEQSKKPGQVELSEAEYDKLIMDLEEFENGFYSKLAKSDEYEIIPTMTEQGRFLSKEQLALITKECGRLGRKYLYKVDMTNGSTLLINPKTLKTAHITEGVH